MKGKINIVSFAEPSHRQVNGLDLVVVKYDDDDVSALYGRCLHRGALMKVVARSYRHDDIRKFNFNDRSYSTLNYEMHKLIGIAYASVHY